METGRCPTRELIPSLIPTRTLCFICSIMATSESTVIVCQTTKHQCVWKSCPQILSERDSYPKRSDLVQQEEEKKKLVCTFMLDAKLLKSNQLLYDSTGQGTPQLREPRELFAFPALNESLRAPRWPIECEVIKERIHHIEWIPPLPEYFYQPTGQEKVPQIVGEEKGTVVYHIDSAAAANGAHFTSSRVGGRRGIVRPSAVDLKGPEDNTLLFESRFESGNLQKAVRVDTFEYELTLQPDLYTGKHTQWFYFRVQNTRRAVTYRFTIVNLTKAKSLYATGMKPLMYSQLDAQTGHVGWRREGGDIRYYKSSQGVGQRPLYCLTWTVQFPYDYDTCFFAHFYPYTYSDLQRYLLRVANDPARAPYCKLRSLCRSLAGNTVYLLTVTSPSRSPREAAAKKAVVISARVHPGEPNGSWVMKGLLDFILSDAPDARLLRDAFLFKVVPMLNPDGVVVGNSRCSLTGRDMNRHYGTILKDSFPCIWHTRNMIKRILEEREILLYCDFHGHSRKNNVFMYGCNNKYDHKRQLHERVFPLMLSKNAPDKFSFQSCRFKVQKCKEGTGRVVMWRMGIQNSYTLESTFGGSTLGHKREIHFTTEDLKALGYHVCDTLLDFCDPDRSKFRQCLSELQEILQQEICKKREHLGREKDLESTWNDISWSDIESSTSGSDSSDSDGLPVHLLNLVEKKKKKRKKKKKTPLQTRKQRNELRQKNSLIWESKLSEESPERGACADTQKKPHRLFRSSEKSNSSAEKKSELQSARGERGRGSPSPKTLQKLTTMTVVGRNNEIQRKNPGGLAVSYLPKKESSKGLGASLVEFAWAESLIHSHPSLPQVKKLQPLLIPRVPPAQSAISKRFTSTVKQGQSVLRGQLSQEGCEKHATLHSVLKRGGRTSAQTSSLLRHRYCELWERQTRPPLWY
ncbi:cytosolic carboxypeptidase 2 isoform X2 [Ornithorhynchus anatinus]|uniref:cytosolic carboxypeptidase 2 isoform X2 n=1 Tax=Ornithorhynchus anatinus TaxID=9258 RepID=UPI0010A937D8|nr:cytosolic carboxypeptidase 2 isoform X2 [Ornithorhynchus anatinus]